MTRKNGSDEERGVSLLALDQYRRQVDWTPLLTEEEKQQLAVRIERGKAEQRKVCPDVAVVADGKAARGRLVEGMQRLVFFLARKWMRSFRGRELLDLVQEGNVALLELLESQDVVAMLCGPHKFSGLVATTMCHHLLHLLRDRESLLHVSGRLTENLQQMRRVRARLSLDLGRKPSSLELAEALGVTVEQVCEWEMDVVRLKVSSMQALVESGEDEEEPVEINFVSLFQQEVEMDRQRLEALEAMVQETIQTKLLGRQREVIVRWFGLDGQSESLAAIAATLGITYQSVSAAGHMAQQKLAAYLAVPYGLLCGQQIEREEYTAEQAAEVLGLTRNEFLGLVRRGELRRLPFEWYRVTRYGRADVERLTASHEEWFA